MDPQTLVRIPAWRGPRAEGRGPAKADTDVRKTLKIASLPDKNPDEIRALHLSVHGVGSVCYISHYLCVT